MAYGREVHSVFGPSVRGAPLLRTSGCAKLRDLRSLVDAPSWRRELGRLDHGRAGPTLLVLAGIHGNEPAGVVAV